jgi:uncharacterized protein
MNCPVCREVALVMADRSGIEIDYCPQCRGVWLDRGELDKIIERSAQTPSLGAQAASSGVWVNEVPRAEPPAYQQPAYREPRRDYDDDDYKKRHRDYDDDDRDYYKRKKRKGFLGELFDFD